MKVLRSSSKKICEVSRAIILSLLEGIQFLKFFEVVLNLISACSSFLCSMSCEGSEQNSCWARSDCAILLQIPGEKGQRCHMVVGKIGHFSRSYNANSACTVTFPILASIECINNSLLSIWSLINGPVRIVEIFILQYLIKIAINLLPHMNNNKLNCVKLPIRQNMTWRCVNRNIYLHSFVESMRRHSECLHSWNHQNQFLPNWHQL